MNREISIDTVNRDVSRLINPSNVSDGYHTFQELYDDRASFMFSTMLMLNDSNFVWVSKKHDDDTMFDGMFIAGIVSDSYNIIYHIDIKFWDMFSIFNVLDTAPKWNGKDNSMNMFIRSIFDRHPDSIVTP